MHRVSAKEFSLWQKKQLLKGGSQESLLLILEAFGGITYDEINIIKFN